MLAPSELETLRLLARGETYEQILQKLGINRANLHTRCDHIRRKTGIRSTKDPVECRLWLHRQREPLNPNPKTQVTPTPQQMEVMRLVVAGHSYAQIGQLLGVHHQTAQNAASQGCKRAGISNQGWNRTKAIAEYLANRGKPDQGVSMSDPMF